MYILHMRHVHKLVACTNQFTDAAEILDREAMKEVSYLGYTVRNKTDNKVHEGGHNTVTHFSTTLINVHLL